MALGDDLRDLADLRDGVVWLVAGLAAAASPRLDRVGEGAAALDRVNHDVRNGAGRALKERAIRVPPDQTAVGGHDIDDAAGNVRVGDRHGRLFVFELAVALLMQALLM